MVRCATFACATGVLLLLAANASAHFTPTAVPAKADVTLLAAHFGGTPSVCTVGFGCAGIPTDKVGWLGEPETATRRPSAPLRAALAAHGRFYRPRRYRTDAVYFVQPAWLGGAATNGELDRWNLDVFVQVVAAAEADCRFKFQLMFDLDAEEPPEMLDLIELVEVDVEDSNVAGLRLPYGAGLNPALPASFGAIQHAMATMKAGMEQSGDGISGAFGGLASGVWTPPPAGNGDTVDPYLSELHYDLHNGANQEDPTGWASSQLAPEPSSLAVFCGLSLLAVWGAALRRRKRKPA
jgi:hypothetical protein